MSNCKKFMGLFLAALLFPLLAGAQCYTLGCRAFSSTSTVPGVTWNYVATNGQSCSAGGSCSPAFSPVSTANSIVVVTAYVTNGNSITSMSLNGCSSGGGASIGGSGTSYAGGNSVVGGMAWIYNLGNSGGCTSINLNLASAEAGTWSAYISEFTRSTGTPTLDALASSNTNATACTSCTGSAFSSLSGASDLLVQILDTGTGTGSPSPPYVWDALSIDAYALNSTHLPAPTWTQTSGGFLSFGVAFK
jgi:hypothetical protein